MRHPMPNTDDTVTIYDVAREAGVSMATVSRVVNGNKNVREVTRKKVQAVIDRLDYRPNQVARGLASRKTTTVGVLVPNLSNSYFASLAQGVEDIAGMYNYDMIIANCDDSEEKEIKLINSLLARQVDGIIYMGYRISDRVRNEFSRTRTPIVLAGTVDGKGDLPSVNVDYKEAAAEAVKLLAKNSKKIAYVSGPLSDTINQRDRLEGYKAALKAKKIKFTDKLVFEADYKYEEGYDLAEKVKKSGATAAYVADDELALGLLNGLADAGVKIPKDFEILTSNDSQLAKYARPNLSSITLPVYDLGAIAMRLLTKIMLKEEVDERQVVLDYTITSRQSTK